MVSRDQHEISTADLPTYGALIGEQSLPQLLHSGHFIMHASTHQIISIGPHFEDNCKEISRRYQLRRFQETRCPRTEVSHVFKEKPYIPIHNGLIRWRWRSTIGNRHDSILGTERGSQTISNLVVEQPLFISIRTRNGDDYSLGMASKTIINPPPHVCMSSLPSLEFSPYSLVTRLDLPSA